MYQTKKRFSFLLILVLPFMFSGYKSEEEKIILLKDNFENQRVGVFSTFVKAFAEYHYIPEAAPKFGWSVSTHEGDVGSQRAWWIYEENDKKLMVQTYDNPDNWTHPIVIAGDSLWTDYSLTVSLLPGSTKKQSGILFRYQNDRCYYFFGIDKDKIVLKMVKHETAYHTPYEKILAEKKYTITAQKYISLNVTVNGSKIIAGIDGEVLLNAEDTNYLQGKIGLMSDVPTKFNSVLVTTSKDEFQKISARQELSKREEFDLQKKNPQMVLWKKIETPGFGVGRNLRFGDMNNDGQSDVLIGQVMSYGPKGDNNELYCMTAMTLDGNKLWQIGKPDVNKYFLTTDIPFQIHDIDRDGKNEVIYCMHSELIVADGATGKTKYKVKTPLSKISGEDEKNVLGDCLFFCDISGKGYDSDIVIKDRYVNFWVLNNKLEMIWKASSKKGKEIGHYPWAFDIDYDGKDELAIGYALFDNDGTTLWSHDNLQQHADGIAILNFNPGIDGEAQIMYAASDEGYMRMNLKGDILKHHFIGHVQNPTVANFRNDLPGLETVSINFHGNQGIITFYDNEGNIYKQFEPVQHGSMMLPLNWTGSGEEYFVLSADVEEGGVYDGWGRRVLTFPGDGHPSMCNAVMDICGDARDEIVVWDPYEIRVYTQSDNPKKGKIYKPQRNPLYNYSNYQATVSLPGWSE